MIQQVRKDWNQNGETATDWDIIDELKGKGSSEVQFGITSLASGSTNAKRGPPTTETTQKMNVDFAKETQERVHQIQAQIAILQRELSHLMPAEDA